MGNILEQVNNYYTNKLLQNGATPQGVDWNSVESQFLRFRVLSQVISTGENFSVLDYGCGFGSLYDYLNQNTSSFQFTGFDISKEMIASAREKFQDKSNCEWLNELTPDLKRDYVIASGLFNVRLEVGDDEWKQYILDTIEKFHQHSSKGFSFNCLTKYSDKEYMKDYLYYTDPLWLFDFCKKHYSRNVALLHDYELYEFTIIVRK